MVCLWVLGLAASQQWASGRATEDLVDVMREGTGSFSVSEWYHLLCFHSIKIAVLCSEGLKLLEVIERNYIHCFWTRYGTVMGMQTSNALPGQYTVIA